MSKDGIDASIGLTYSLELFKRYQKNGVLQAERLKVPGVRGRCKAFLSLVDGQVVSVYVEDEQGKRHSSDKDTLCRLDREKGPFEWRFIPQSVAPNQPWLTEQFQSPPPNSPASSLKRTSIPRVIAGVPWDRLSAWTPQQKEALYLVLTMINGERTLEHIKTVVRLPPDLVDELLHILLEGNVITLSTY